MRHRLSHSLFLGAALAAALLPGDAFGQTKSEIVNIFHHGVKLEDAGDYAGAQKVFLGGLEKAKAAKNDLYVADFLDQLGFVSYKTSQWAQAVDYDTQNLSLVEKMGDDKRLARSLGELANATLKQGQAPRAITLQLRALDLRRKIGDAHATAVTQADLGTAYAVSGDYEKAAANYSDAAAALEKTTDTEATAYTVNNLARANTLLKQYDKALENFQRAAELYKQLGDKEAQSQAQKDIGVVYERSGHPAEAAKAYAEADHILAAASK